MRKEYFIIVWINEEGQRLYLEHEEYGLLDPTTHNTIREPMGYFCTDLKDARMFLERWQAEAVSAGYEGAHVETIKWGGC